MKKLAKYLGLFLVAGTSFGYADWYRGYDQSNEGYTIEIYPNQSYSSNPSSSGYYYQNYPQSNTNPNYRGQQGTYQRSQNYSGQGYNQSNPNMYYQENQQRAYQNNPNAMEYDQWNDSQRNYQTMPNTGYSNQGMNRQGFIQNPQNKNPYGTEGYYDSKSNQMMNKDAGTKTDTKEESTSFWSRLWGKDSKKTVPDQEVISHIRQLISSNQSLSPGSRNIQITSKDGKVTLEGRVRNKNEKNQIESMIKNVEGVEKVNNNLSTEE